MFHPTRGGVRGGKDQFTWDDVKSDKDRECYLGHSVMAPVGRWQQGKDLTWYAKDKKTAAKQKKTEFEKAKELEEKALMAALGYKVADKPEVSESESEQSESVSEEEVVEKKPSKRQHSRESKKVEHKKTKSNKKELDIMLMKLVTENGIERVLKALGK